MPYTMNGVGTAYWGKAERTFRRDTCGHCGNVADLASYDTTKYFVVIFLPLIPLGKVRVFDECPSCRRHQVMKLSRWESMRESEVGEALAAFRRQSSDAGVATRVLQICAAYRDEERFLRISKEVLQHHGRNAEVLSLVSEILEELGHSEQAEAALRRSLQAEESPERRQRLLWLVIRNGRPGEARPGLASAYAEQNADALPSLYLLVEGFQAQGQHTEALAELEAIEQAFPDEGVTPSFQHLRQLSTSRRQSGEAVVSPALEPLRQAGDDGDWAGSLARWGAPALLLLLFGAGGWWLFNNGTRHPVYFVNGLETPYFIEVAGHTVELPAGGHVLRRLPLRRSISITPADGAPPFEPFDVKIDLSFREGLDSAQIPVVNPDRTALVLLETVDYLSEDFPVTRAMEEEQLPWEVHAGEVYYSFGDVDFPFKDFPEEIEMSSGRSRHRKSRLGLLELPAIFAWSYLQAEQAAPGAAVGWITAQIRLGLANEELHPYLLAASVDEEQFRAVAGDHLAARPVEVGWHRAYQTLLSEKNRDAQLEEEYRRLVEAEPESSDLLYLLARVTVDPEAKNRLLDRALAVPEPSAWSIYGASFRALTEARFETALELAQQALEAKPTEIPIQRTEYQAMLANGRFRALANRSQESRNGELDLDAVSDEQLLLTALGEVDRAESNQEQILQALKTERAGRALRQEWQSRLQAARHLGGGDLEGYGDAIAGLEGVPFPLHRALLKGDGSAIEAALAELEEPTPKVLLLAHLACLGTSPDSAARLLDQAVARLRQGTSEDRTLAEALATRRPPIDLAPLLTLRLMPDLKAPALATLAGRGGPVALTLRRRARELAYDPGFEGRFLQRMLE